MLSCWRQPERLWQRPRNRWAPRHPSRRRLLRPRPASNWKPVCAKWLLCAEESALPDKPADDDQKKKIELLQKQVETLEKQIKIVADQLKKMQAPGPAVEKLETQAATLEAHSIQAANRDVELAGAVDDLREHIDAQERYPQFPAPLKELFLPSGTSETPLSIYGALAVGYSKILGDTASAANGAGRPPTPGGFYFGEFTPDFLLKLNDWIFLEAESASAGDGSVSAGSFAQADFFVTDWLTIIAGRFVAPIGWFNERLNNPWINKLPGDAPGSGPPLWRKCCRRSRCWGCRRPGPFTWAARRSRWSTTPTSPTA